MPGRQLPISGRRGRVIGYGPSDLRFFNSQWHSLSIADIDRFFDHPDLAGCDVMWLSLSTGPRNWSGSTPNDVLFHALQNKQQVHDKLGHISDVRGVMIWAECGTQEYMISQLGTDPAAMEDYISEAAEEFGDWSPQCMMPYREMDDLWTSMGNDPVRLQRYNDHLKAVNAAGPRPGLHLGSMEIPDVRMYQGLQSRVVWLFQWKFSMDVNAPFRGKAKPGWPGYDPADEDADFDDAADYMTRWANNRQIDWVASEHSIGMDGYPAQHTVAEALARGQAFVGLPRCLGDWSGGAGTAPNPPGTPIVT